MGEKMSAFKTGKQEIETVQLDFKSLADYRKKFPVMMDADEFKIAR